MKSHIGALLLGLLFIEGAQAAEIPVKIDPPVTTNLVGYSFTLASVLGEETAAMVDSFQWMHAGTNLVDNERIVGSTAHMLTIFNSMPEDAGQYRLNVLLTNNLQVSGVATVHVIDIPVIRRVYMQYSGNDLLLTADASGGLLSYQWFWQGEPIPGATNNPLRLLDAYTSANAGYYSVEVTNVVGAATRANAILFTKPPDTGSYYGLFSETNGVALDSSGYFQCTVSGSKGSFSGKLFIGKKSYRFSGVFSPDHTAQVRAVGRSELAPLFLSLQLLSTNSLPQVIGTIQNDAWTASLQAHRRHFSSRLTTTLEGRHTLLLQNTNWDNAVPDGSGFGTVKIKADGRATVTGYLPDGTKFAQKTYLSRVGDWPLRATVNKEQGSLLGWIRVARQATSSIQGSTVAWVRAPGNYPLYPEGIAMHLLPSGSAYVELVNSPGLPFRTGVASLYGGDLFLNSVPIVASSEVVAGSGRSFSGTGPEQIRLKVDKAGRVSGHFIHPITQVKTRIRGVALQQQRLARGFFLSEGTSGAFSLDP